MLSETENVPKYEKMLKKYDFFLEHLMPKKICSTTSSNFSRSFSVFKRHFLGKKCEKVWKIDKGGNIVGISQNVLLAIFFDKTHSKTT